jgi:hypothetical protein
MRRLQPRIQHAVGEVVYGEIGNFLENPNAEKKSRPMVVLATGECQHLVAGLTTQPYFNTTGGFRVPIPNPKACGLSRPGYLWGGKPVRVSRLDVRRHLGWADPEMVQAIAEAMRLSPRVTAQLWKAATQRHVTGLWQLGT